MLGLRRALVLTTLFASSFVSAAPSHDDSIVDWTRLSSILDTIDTNVLHSVLHNLSPKFKDGVFSHDRSAVEHVHSENPIMASKLVFIAKRQNNGTTTVSPASTTSVEPEVSSAVQSQITNTASTVPAPTTVKVAPATPTGATAIRTVDGGVVYSTTGGGVVTMTSSAVTVRFTKSTSTHLFYTTLPDGSVQTSTTLIVVNAPVTDTADPTGAAAGAATSVGVQNGAQPTAAIGFGAILAGALGVVAAL